MVRRNYTSIYDYLVLFYLRSVHIYLCSLYIRRPVHEFVGDLISAAFDRELQNVAKEAKKAKNYCEQKKKTSLNYVLPPPLYTKEDEYECNLSVPFIIDIHFDHNVKPSIWKDLAMSPNESWVHTDEGRNKFGLVSEFGKNITTTVTTLSIPVPDLLPPPPATRRLWYAAHSEVNVGEN